MRKRIDWIDGAKAIGILAVIIGHTLSKDEMNLENTVRSFLFSFHLPIFFIVAGYTFSPSPDAETFLKRLEKSFKQLFLLALFLFLILRGYSLLQNFKINLLIPFLKESIYTLLYSSGRDVNVLGTKVEDFGKMWFLVALFWVRTLYDYLSLRIRSRQFKYYVLSLTLIGYIISRILWLPFSIDIVLVALIFFYFGDYLSNNNLIKVSNLNLVVFFLTWMIGNGIILFFTQSNLDMAGRQYPLFPFSLFTGIVASLFIIQILQLLHLPKFLLLIGQESLLILSVHSLDNIYKELWRLTGNHWIDAIIRILVDLLIVFIIRRILMRYSTLKSKSSYRRQIV